MEKEEVWSGAASEDFSALLGLLESDKPLVMPCFRLPESLTRFSIRVEGPRYDECMPGEQMRTLWEIQKHFFRVAAFLVHDTREFEMFSEEERKTFELGFETCEGGWSVRVVADGFWRTLFEKTEGKTDAKMVALLAMGAFCVWSATGACDTNKRRRVQAWEGAVGIAEEIKEQLPQPEEIRYWTLVAALSPQGRKRYHDVSESIVRAKCDLVEKLAIRSPDATRIEVGGAEYQGAELEALRARSRRASEGYDYIYGRYNIVALNKDTPNWSMQIREVSLFSNLYPLTNSNNDVTVSILEDEMLEIDLAKAKETILDAFCRDRDVQVTYVVEKLRTFLCDVEMIEDDPTEL